MNNGGIDRVQGNEGADVVLGDNGTFIYNDPGHPELSTLDIVRTLDVELGGPDTIDGDGGTDLVLAGRGGDTVRGGTQDDIVFGDFAEALLLANLPSTLRSVDITEGGADDLYGNENDDLIAGGAAGDRIDGDEQDDLIFGDAVRVHRRPGVITDPRFRALVSTQIYGKDGVNAGVDQAERAANTDRNYRDPHGTYAPSWAEYEVKDLFHSEAEATLPGSFGDDYIAGGAEHDVIFGQFGNDTVQGDGSIDGAVAGSPVLARREADNSLTVVPSFEAATDGTTTSRATAERRRLGRAGARTTSSGAAPTCTP